MTDLPKSPEEKASKQNALVQAKPSDKDSTAPEADANKTDAPSAKKSNYASKHANPPAQKKTGFLWFVTIINFILLALLVFTAYWYYTQIRDTKSEEASAVLEVSEKLEREVSKLESSQQQISATAERQVQSLKQDLQSQSQSIDNLLAQVLQNAETDAALQKRLAEMSGRRPSDWLLAEANYLVNMAGRKLYLESDIRTAMTLLQEADARLADLNDPALFPVRALIAGDIQTLKAINPTSTNSIALALAGMLAKVDTLPLDKLQLPEPEATEDLTLSEDVSDFRENLSRTWRAIVGPLYRVSDLEQPLEPYLAERQQWLIEQQLKHAIAQAQSAVLNEQQALYVATMDTAVDLLETHYQNDDASVQQFINALQELKSADFTRNLPKALESQASLKDILESRVQNLFNNMPSTEDAATAEGSQI